jgi:hypothetical protein
MHHPRRFPPIVLLALLLALSAAACGADEPAPTAATPTPPPAEPAQEPHVDFEPGHSKAVRDYYGEVHNHPAPDSEDGITLDSEEEYRQPPHPAAGGIGDTITLTGSNLGVRMEATVTGVATSGRFTTVGLRLANTGIAIFDSQIKSAVLVDADGRRARVKAGVTAPCSKGFQDPLWIDVGAERSGCLVFARTARPAELRFALEQVPVEAGGKWTLR